LIQTLIKVARGASLGLLLLNSLGAQALPKVEVYKTKTCGCCGKWVEHLRANSFNVEVKDVPSTAEYRQKYGVPDQLASCHTAVVGQYTVEGHVPAADIRKMLKERPKGSGIAVPGMPMGSPGMEQGGRKDAYSVVLFDRKGNTSDYTRYPAGK
jgi:hypothetical protein